DRYRAVGIGEFCGKAPRTPPEYNEIRQGISAQPIRAMQSCCRLPRGEEPGHIGHLRIAIDANSPHHVVSRWTDFHRLFRDVKIGKLLELVIHAGEFALDMLLCFRHALLDPGDIEEDTAVR